jgi:DNA-binding NtrC family response regulator
MNLLLLVFNVAQDLGAGLLAALGAAFPREQLQLRTVEGNCSERDVYSQLDGLLSDGSPKAAFIVKGANDLNDAEVCLKALSARWNKTPVIIVSEDCNPHDLLRLLQLGATDFIVQPLVSSDVLPRVWRAIERKGENESLVQRLKSKIGLKQIIGSAESFLVEVNKIPLVSKCDVGVLISGETGTGKEMCARAIHYLSRRASYPFVPVNCGAIPTELFENELFGHERGAFTGAVATQAGLIQQAERGALFLDEIDCLPLLAQTKLLRFLQDKEFKPLGATKSKRADVRIIAASNANLEETVAKGKLRKDLYYRLNVIPIILPPLRERREDIKPLAEHFLATSSAEFNQPAKQLTPAAMCKLEFYDWPGNVRELEHTIERAVMLSQSTQIDETDIALPTQTAEIDDESFQEAKARFVAEFEKSYIQKLLVTYQGNISRAAQAASKNRRAFWELIRKHRIDVSHFKPSA